MWIEATTKPLRVQFRHAEVRLQPGRPVELPDTDGRKLLAQAGGKVRAVDAPRAAPIDAPPAPPLESGWLVAYRDRDGGLCGGGTDREHGTVQRCEWNGTAWTVCLTDGHQLPLSRIRSVGRTDPTGQIVSAWMVREHGYDGETRCGLP